MKSEIIVTDDDSKTLLIPELNETYHSTKGALAEALHIFIKEGIVYSDKKQLSIFEMGFGTGLNAILSLSHAIENKISIEYETIEKYPLDYKSAKKLDYLEMASLNKIEEEYRLMFESEHFPVQLHPNFQFNSRIGDFKSIALPTNKFDIIFYDAFGPKVQANLWSQPMMEKCFDILKENGFLVTYCAQGQFKRNLKAAGFEVESIPGPPGKREMTRAFKR